MKVKLFTNDKIGLLTIWVIMFMGFPFTISQAFNLPSKLIMVLAIFILFILLIVNKNKIVVSSIVIFILSLQIIFSFFFYFIHHDAGYINLTFQFIVPLIIYTYISTALNFTIISNSIIKFLIISGIAALVTFFLCFIFNISEYSVFENPDGRTGYNFIIGFTNYYLDVGFTKFIRPSGYFDEPGTLAYYLIFAILVNDLTVNNKIYRKILFFCGIFTTSVAFYIVLIFYGFFYLKKNSLIKTLVLSISIISIISFLFLLLDSSKQDLIYAPTIGRIESIISPKTADGSYIGDNRSDLVETAKEAILDSPIIGQGISYSSNINSKFYGKFMGANILGVFGVHGLLGGVIFSLHVFYYIWICFKKRWELNIPQKSCLLFTLLLVQRPDYIGGVIPYISILVLIFLSLNFDKKAKNLNNYSSI